MSICRLLPYALFDGPRNMAADEVLLHSAATGIPALRFYGWTEATLSLGYFQPERLRQQDTVLAALPWVRRPTGGETLVHHHELTYALALPAGPLSQTAKPWSERMHVIIARALATLGVSARLHQPGEETGSSGFLCFQHFTPGDLLIGSAKITGSAQRRQRKALLQHGGILLASSPFTPHLQGIEELTGRRVPPEVCIAEVGEEFSRESNLRLLKTEWTGEEKKLVEELAVRKYGNEAWNGKR